MYAEGNTFEGPNYIFPSGGGSELVEHQAGIQMMKPGMIPGKPFQTGYGVPSSMGNMVPMGPMDLTPPMEQRAHQTVHSPTIKHTVTVPLTPNVNISPNAQMIHFQTPNSTMSPTSLTPTVAQFSPLQPPHKGNMFDPSIGQDMSNMGNINFSHNFSVRENIYFDMPEKPGMAPPSAGNLSDGIYSAENTNGFQPSFGNTHNVSLQRGEGQNYHSDGTEDEAKFPKDNILDDSPTDQAEITVDDVLNDDPFEYSSDVQFNSKDDIGSGIMGRDAVLANYSEADFGGASSGGLNIRLPRGAPNPMNRLQSSAHLVNANPNNRGKLSKKKSTGQLSRAPKKVLRKAKSFNESLPFATSNSLASQTLSYSKNNNPDAKEPKFSMSDCSSTFAITKSNNYSFVMENDINNKARRKTSPKPERSVLRRPNSIACFDNEIASASSRNNPKVLKNMQSGMVLFQLQLNNNK